MNHKMERSLHDRPWLIPFVEAGDTDIEPAQRRFSSAQGRIRAEIHRSGVDVKRVRRVRGLQTTAFDTDGRAEGDYA